MTFFFITVGITGFYFHGESHHSFESIYHNQLLSIQYLNSIRTLISANEASLYRLILIVNPKEKQIIKSDIERRAADWENLLSRYLKLKNDKTHIIQRNALKHETEKIKEARFKLINNNKPIYSDYKSYLLAVKNFNHKFEHLVEYNQKLANSEHKHNSHENINSNIMIISAVILALIICILLCIIIVRMIIKPIYVLEKQMEKVANGDLNIEPIKVTFKDELSNLSNSFNIMTQNMCNLIQKEQKLSTNEKLLRNIITSFRNSLDATEINKILVTEIGKAFNADMCFILPYDPEKEEFLPVDTYSEYRSSPEIKSLVGRDPNNPDVKLFIEAFKKVKEANYSNIENYIHKRNLQGTKAEAFLREFNIKSSYNISILYANQLLGFIILEYTKDYCELDEDSLDLLRTLATQAGVAIYQSRLYLMTLQQAERESLLRKISETIRNSLDINEVLETISNEIINLFNADTISIIEHPDRQNASKCIYRGIFSATDQVSMSKNNDLDPRISEFWAKESLFKGVPLVFNNIPESNAPDYIKKINEEIGSVSIVCIPIMRNEDKWGTLGIYMAKANNWQKDEITLLTCISDQIYLAIKQAELYATAKRNAEKEALLRKISDTIRSTLDIEEVKNKIVEEVSNVFDADRCLIRLYDYNERLSPTASEHLQNKNEKSFNNVCINNELNSYFKELHKQRKPVYIPNLNIIPDSLAIKPALKSLFEPFNIKSEYGIPIYHKNELLGSLILQYTSKEVYLDSEEFRLLGLITDQAGMAIKQAELYSAIQRQVKKEKVLRKVATVIKGSPINEILNSICKEIAEIFNVERVIIRDFMSHFEERFIWSEFIADEKLKRFNNLYKQHSDILANYWIKTFTDNNQKTCIVNNVSEWDAPEDIKNTYNCMGIKSIICVPLKSSNNKLGGFSLSNHTEYKHWIPEDINLLEDIAQHISLAIRETNLYNQAQFLANVSHEIKTPLSVIDGHSQILLKDRNNFSDHTHKSLTSINDNVNRINNIINNLLYLLKLEDDYNAGDIPFDNVYIDDILDSAIKYCSDKAKFKNIKLKLCSDNICANVNILLFQQAIINLITNAIQYSNNDSIIEIEANESQDNIEILIKDYGEGIPEEHLSYIFERFYRVDKSRSRETGGTGLGLSIVKLIIEAHRGQIFVDSIPDQGTTFTIHLLKN